MNLSDVLHIKTTRTHGEAQEYHLDERWPLRVWLHHSSFIFIGGGRVWTWCRPAPCRGKRTNTFPLTFIGTTIKLTTGNVLLRLFGLTRLSVALQQVLMDEVMDYLSLCYLPPTPSFFLLLLLCWEMNSPPVCCICMSL